MNEKLTSKNELNAKEISQLNQQLQKEKEEKSLIKHQVNELQKQKSKIPTLIWILIIAAALFTGWLIGRTYI
jgi:predicted  nucleic acid-binding Zn-ribbon protein